MTRADSLRRLQEYATRNNLALRETLGSGVHGNVVAADFQTDPQRLALKVHEGETGYVRERDVYLRLREHGISKIFECSVPRILEYDDQLWIIEMSVVKRPFVLDFAGAYLDEPPHFSADVLADWEAQKREEFGSRWPEAKAVVRELEKFGVYMIDVNPGNISFGV